MSNRNNKKNPSKSSRSLLAGKTSKGKKLPASNTNNPKNIPSKQRYSSKDQALDAIQANVCHRWSKKARHALLIQAQKGPTTLEDALLIHGVPAPENRLWACVIPRTLKNKIKLVGHKTASARQSHSGIIRIWEAVK